MLQVTGWAITEWAVAIAALLTAVGVIWTKAVKPLRSGYKAVKAWMDRVEGAVLTVEEQLKTNGGSTLRDRVDLSKAAIEELQASVALLLEHDHERDVDGKRYGSAGE